MASYNNIQVQDPSLHKHNSNINVPSSGGNDLITAVGYRSAGVTVAAGIKDRSRKLGCAPPIARAVGLATGGAIGGVLYVATNYFNTRIQISL